MAGYAEDARAIAAESGWIAAGNFLIWTDPLLYQADVIVWLEIPWPIAIWRIISRHIIKSLRGINPYPGLRGIKLLLILLKGIRPYNVDKVNADSSVAEAVRQYLAEHEADTALADTETLVTRWKTCLKDIPFTRDFSLMYLEKYKAKVFPVRNKADRTRLLESLTSR
jgi:hypothetical protein